MVKLLFIYKEIILIKMIFISALLFCCTVSANIELVILGVAQDAGYPQVNCYKPHCMNGWQHPSQKRGATALAVIDHQSKEKFLFEATPNMAEQLYHLHAIAPDEHYKLNGVFLTHGHIGHYTGLMFFGREAAGSKEVPVYAMPRMQKYLTNNGPWSQLVSLNNIKLNALQHNKNTQLTSQFSIKPILVPHRDEYTETVGYFIQGGSKTALFIPDIDKWGKWQTSIVDLIKLVDYAFVDATFYDQREIPNRDMSEVPHPFVQESMQRFQVLSAKDKAKVHFIHFNHSNPLLNANSKESKKVITAGFNISTEGMKFLL